ncbi:hypothetical protein [Alicyclobacillus sp. SP_1]|uniref:hypothetical protein n=1 Tax=Alicyclobacillus sp. SP_1 TaxID=2942475 RepID=UPI0021578760|nr:hypothetical protein [Alicyclobacillus sp. SP_1]
METADEHFERVHLLGSMILEALDNRRFVDVFVLLQHRMDLIERCVQGGVTLSLLDIETASECTQLIITRIQHMVEDMQSEFTAYVSQLHAHRAYRFSQLVNGK